jgi:transposase
MRMIFITRRMMWIIGLLLILASCGSGHQEEESRSVSKRETEHTVLAENLSIPWSIVKNGEDFYLTERTGGMVEIRNGRQSKVKVNLSRPLASQPEAGFMGLVLHPEFNDNRQAFAYYTYNDEDGTPYNRVVVLERLENSWDEKEVLLDKIAPPPYCWTTTNNRRGALMAKFSNKEKLKVAKRYIHELFSYRDLATHIGVDESVLRYWVMLYRYHGDEAFSFPYTNYPSAFKLRVIQFIQEANYSIREASAIFHIPDPCMVRRWMKKWELGGLDALKSTKKGTSIMTSRNQKKRTGTESSNQSIEEMKKELEHLRMENAYLKKLKALVQEEESPKKSKRK